MGYEAVIEELRRGFRDEALMAQSYAEAMGDERASQALYLKYRLQALDRAAQEALRNRFRFASWVGLAMAMTLAYGSPEAPVYSSMPEYVRFWIAWAVFAAILMII